MFFNLPDTTRTWLVAPVGNDSNSGHPSSNPVNLANDAFLTIQNALINSAWGDTVIVWPGDYAENVTMAIKSNPKIVNLIGTNREMCRIVPTTGVPLTVMSGSRVENLSCIGYAGSYTSGIAVGSGYSSNFGIIIKNCYAYGEQDGFVTHSEHIIRLIDSFFESQYDGINIGSTRAIFAQNCAFKANGGINVPVHAVQSPGRGFYRGCRFVCDVTDSNAQEVGGVDLIENQTKKEDKAIFDCCNFDIIVPNRTANVFGVNTNHANNQAILNNCSIHIDAPNASGGYKHLWNAAGSIIVNGCKYDLSKTTGTITQGDSGLTKWLQQNAPVGAGL